MVRDAEWGQRASRSRSVGPGVHVPGQASVRLLSSSRQASVSDVGPLWRVCLPENPVASSGRTGGGHRKGAPGRPKRPGSELPHAHGARIPTDVGAHARPPARGSTRQFTSFHAFCPDVREARDLVATAPGSSLRTFCVSGCVGRRTGVPGVARGGHACPFDISQSRSVMSPRPPLAGGRALGHHTPPTASDRSHQRTDVRWLVGHILQIKFGHTYHSDVTARPDSDSASFLHRWSLIPLLRVRWWWGTGGGVPPHRGPFRPHGLVGGAQLLRFPGRDQSMLSLHHLLRWGEGGRGEPGPTTRMGPNPTPGQLLNDSPENSTDRKS